VSKVKFSKQSTLHGLAYVEKHLLSFSWYPDLIQCNSKCTSKENKTEVTIVSPKCHSCDRTRCAQCKTYLAVPSLDDTIYEADVLGMPAVQKPSRPPKAPPGPSRPRENRTFYYCVSGYSGTNLLRANVKKCSCGNGPQLLDTQPACITCSHRVCSRCIYERK
jgi:hypothetical protein